MVRKFKISKKSSQSKEQGVEELHFLLGLIAEEKAAVNETFPELIVGKKNEPNENQQAADSFMEDEITGLLIQLGTPLTSSDVAKLKAIECEFQRLTVNAQTNEAAEVQGLYQWLLKKVNGESKFTDHNSGTNCNINSNAADKYRDCLAINPTHIEANIYLGRTLLKLKNIPEASKYFLNAVSLNPCHSIAQFYLGLAMTHPEVLNKSKEICEEGIKFIEQHISKIKLSLWYLKFIIM